MKKLIKTVKIIEGVFQDPFFVYQFIFIYPRFMLFDNSLSLNKANYFSNNLYIGDNFKKLIYVSAKKTKYLNGFLEVLIYEKKYSFEHEEYLKSYNLKVSVPEQKGCWCCLYNKKRICKIFKFDIKDEKYACDSDWEEKDGI